MDHDHDHCNDSKPAVFDDTMESSENGGFGIVDHDHDPYSLSVHCFPLSNFNYNCFRLSALIWRFDFFRIV